MANRNQGQNQGGTGRSGTSNRGFASMDQAQQREIARMGGEAVSENRLHMAEIGRKGGEASAESRAQQRAARARSQDGVGVSDGGRVAQSATADGHAFNASSNDEARNVAAPEDTAGDRLGGLDRAREGADRDINGAGRGNRGNEDGNRGRAH